MFYGNSCGFEKSSVQWAMFLRISSTYLPNARIFASYEFLKFLGAPSFLAIAIGALGPRDRVLNSLLLYYTHQQLLFTSILLGYPTHLLKSSALLLSTLIFHLKPLFLNSLPQLYSSTLYPQFDSSSPLLFTSSRVEILDFSSLLLDCSSHLYFSSHFDFSFYSSTFYLNIVQKQYNDKKEFVVLHSVRYASVILFQAANSIFQVVQPKKLAFTVVIQFLR